jgi:hypothetical protein
MKFCIFSILLLIPISVFAGNGGRGGTPEAITVSAYTRYITGHALRDSVLNYLDTLDLDQITDPVDQDVKKVFIHMNKNNALRNDILTQGTYLVGLNNCIQDDRLNPDSANPNVRAWTHTGKNGTPNIGGKICFDVAGLVVDHVDRGLSLKDAAVEITALVYHEYVHHFQMETDDPIRIKAQENTANNVGGYVLRSVEFVPLLEWKNPSTKAATISVPSENDDRQWLEYSLSSTYRDNGERADDVRRLLQKELGLFPAYYIQEAQGEVKDLCPKVYEKKKNEPYNSDEQFWRMYQNCLQEEEALSPNKYPRALMLKALDTLRALESRGLVFVPEGTLSGKNFDRQRMGVMSKEAFNQLSSDGLMDGLVAFGDVDYSFNGVKYQIIPDLADAMTYLDFSEVYDPTTRQWTKKYQPGSLEDVVIQRTNVIISSYEKADKYSNEGEDIRWVVSKNLGSILRQARSQGSNEKATAQQLVTNLISNEFPKAK